MKGYKLTYYFRTFLFTQYWFTGKYAKIYRIPQFYVGFNDSAFITYKVFQIFSAAKYTLADECSLLLYK